MSGSGDSKRKDIAWKYATPTEGTEEMTKKGYKYFTCNFCSKKISGGVKRVKDHLSGNHNNVAPCAKVPPEVKDEISLYLKSSLSVKHANQRNFEEMVSSGSYYNSNEDKTSTKDVNSCPTSTVGSRGVRGPMDRFMMTSNEDGKLVQPPHPKEHRNQVCLDIGRFFFENGMPFHCANSPSFVNMVRSIGDYGRNLKPPTGYELSSWILKEEVETTNKIVDEIKATWKQTGVSLLSDGWSDMRNRSLINFLVNNQHGTVFLRTIDASDCVKDAQKLFELLDEVIEEIGEDIVVQVITDNASAYKAAGRLLMEKRKSLYWTPCAAHCIDLMLEKIGDLPTHKNALLKAKKVCNFIHNHQWVLSLTRKYAKKDLLRPAATRFATAYLTLESMLQLKQPLQSMFVSSEWAGCAWARKPEGQAVKKIIMDDNSFWKSVVYVIKTTGPLVHVLRIVDGEQTPAMGFIYGAMDEAKENIARNLDREVASYKEIWSIIDQKWDVQMHRDLHAAAYFLNPRFKWSDNVSQHPEVKRGLYNCMDRMIKDPDTFAKVDEQIFTYSYRKGFFSHRACLNAYQIRPPVEWWDHFGDEVPELKAFAMRVLGLTCSASACERNWSTFNQVHTKRRNRLTTLKLNKLVYIMYNRRLKQKYLKKQSQSEQEDPLIVENAPSDDEWIAEPSDEADESNENVNIEIMEIENRVASSSSSKKRKTPPTTSYGIGKHVRGLVDDEFEEEEEYERGGDESD